MRITELNEIITSKTNAVILLVGKNSVLTNFAISVGKKLAKKLDNKTTVYDVLEINDDSFEDPLPSLLLYQNNVLIDRLFGFHSCNYYFDWICETLNK